MPHTFHAGCRTYFSKSHDRPVLARKPARDKLLFLAGQVRFGEDEYSGGERQEGRLLGRKGTWCTAVDLPG